MYCKNRQTVLIDLDSITADLMTPWSKAYNDKYSDNMRFADNDAWETHMLVKPECGEKVYDLLTYEMFINLEPLQGAVAAINRLAGCHNVYFATTAMRPGVADAKIAWVARHFPALKDCIFTGKDKFLINADYFIDDSPENLRLYRSFHPNAHTIAIEYPYNKYTTVDLMAQSGEDTEMAWAEILDFIL